jgi:hypothetical protein
VPTQCNSRRAAEHYRSMLAAPASKSAGDLVEPTTPMMGALRKARRCLIRIRLNRGCPQSSFYRWKRPLAVCELNCHQMLAQFAGELAVLTDNGRAALANGWLDR